MSYRPPARKPNDPGRKLADIRPELASLERRLFLRGGLTLGALALLTGCDLADDDDFDTVLKAMSRFNDRVQAALFDPKRLAPVYREADITRPFPFNAFYSESQVKTVDERAWKLEVAGLVDDDDDWTLAELRELPQASQITRHICVEGWSAIGSWRGVPFADFLKRIGADTRAQYVAIRCFDDYYTSIDMATALHPQTILALDWDGGKLPPIYGAPVKLRIPTKLGFKNPKYISSIEITNRNPGGFWEDQGYNWFSGS